MKYVICGEISNERYGKLLEFAFAYSDLFCVSTFKTHNKFLKATYFDFFENMKPYEVDKYTCALPQHYQKGQNFHVFKLNSIGKAYLNQFYSFWDWSLPYFPEDLSFLRNKRVWLNCITHERMIIIDSTDERVLYFLAHIGIQLRNI